MSDSARLIRRRTVIGVLIGAVGVGAIGGRILRPRPSSASRLAEFFSRPNGARRIGERYLRDHQESREGLARRFAPAGADPLVWLTRASVADLTVPIRARARSDWARGDVVVVGGWRLCRAEAQACALLALEP